MIYFSIDIETNGLAAGLNSMISLGAAAIDMADGSIVSMFKINLLPLLDLEVDDDTMKFWTNNKEAYARATCGAFPAPIAIKAFVEWVLSIAPEGSVAAAWKPSFDMAFVRYYLHRFYGRDIFGRGGSGLDIKTLAAIAMNKPFMDVKIGNVPPELKGGIVNHTHDALDDAIEQAYVMFYSKQLLKCNL